MVCIGVAIIGMLMIVGEGMSASESEDILGLSFGLITWLHFMLRYCFK